MLDSMRVSLHTDWMSAGRDVTAMLDSMRVNLHTDWMSAGRDVTAVLDSMRVSLHTDWMSAGRDVTAVLDSMRRVCAVWCPVGWVSGRGPCGWQQSVSVQTGSGRALPAARLTTLMRWG